MNAAKGLPNLMRRHNETPEKMNKIETPSSYKDPGGKEMNCEAEKTNKGFTGNINLRYRCQTI